MMKSSRILLSMAAGLVLAGTLVARDQAPTIVSIAASTDGALTADPDSAFWNPVKGVVANRDKMGNPVAKDVMTIRSRWTNSNLYLLFICVFDSLYLKPNPEITRETNSLWNWDVAEAFIGDDSQNINRYKEFEVSPQGEWVDLDIDRSKPGASPDAWLWNSGFKVKARIDKQKKIWYAEMCIPMQSISRKSAAPGLQLRINFFRTQDTGPTRLAETWQPTHAETFHVPAAFGIIRFSTAH